MPKPDDLTPPRREWREAYRLEIDGTGSMVSVSLFGDPSPGDAADYLEWVVKALRARQAKLEAAGQTEGGANG